MDTTQEIDLSDAQAKLSAIVADAAVGRASVIIRDGHPEAVLVSFSEWQRLSMVPWFHRARRQVSGVSEDLPARYDRPICEPEI